LDKLRVANSAAPPTRRDDDPEARSLLNCIPVPLYGSRHWLTLVEGGGEEGGAPTTGSGDDELIIDDDDPPSPMDITPFLPDVRPSTTHSDQDAPREEPTTTPRTPSLTDLLMTIRRRHSDTTRKLESLSAAVVSGTSALEAALLMDRLSQVWAASEPYQKAVDEWADAETVRRN